MSGYTTHKKATSHINCPSCASCASSRVDSNKPIIVESLPRSRRRARLKDRCRVGCRDGIIAVSSAGASAVQALMTAGETAEAIALAREAVKAYRAHRNAF